MAAPTTILHHLEDNAKDFADRPALHDKLSGSWRTRSWSEYNDLTRRAGKAMISLGLGEGDVVTILGANRPEWVISAFGAMRIGGISAGILIFSAYFTLRGRQDELPVAVKWMPIAVPFLNTLRLLL